MRRFRVAIWVATVALGSPIVGCGASEEQPTRFTSPSAEETVGPGARSPRAGEKEDTGSEAGSAGSAIDEQLFIRRADAICRDLNAQLDRFDDADSLSELEQAVSQIKPIVASGTKRLRGLQVPPDLAVSFEQFLSAVEDQSAVLARIGKAAARGDIGGVQRLARKLRRVQDRKRQIAIQVGFSECGSG